MITSGLEANKIHLRPTGLFANKAKRAFLITFCYTVWFYYINLTISPLDRPITAEFTKGFSMKTYQHPLFVNNSNNNHYFTNYSINNRYVSTNNQLNSETNHLINN